MQVPLKITFRNVSKTPDIEAFIGKQTAKLEHVCDHILSCRIAVEQPQQEERTGNPFRVRIGITVPPKQEFVVTREANEGDLHERLPTALRGAFGAMRRQLKQRLDRQRKDVKTDPELGGSVSLLLRKEGFGFIRSLDGRQIYFDRDSLRGGKFDRLEIGTSVRWVEGEVEKGPRASCVRIVNKPDSRIGAS
jgi:cold shock CspA family protein/ribosome-associated translation inhibitor RaiA